MAEPTKSKSRARPHNRQAPPGWQDPLRPVNPNVSAGWLLKWASVAVFAAIVCAYLALCLLFYQGQWQIVFHPAPTITKTPATVGLRFDDIRFNYTETGKPQLDGWWIPSEAGGKYSTHTLLYMHGANGSLSDTVDQLKRLHSLGINVFAFDYRGFGWSDKTHPSEQRVYEDSDAAFAYLTDTRHIDSKNIVVFGEGLGATVGAETALRHSQIQALIIENPSPPALTLIELDSRTSLLPVKMLFRDRFELAPKLSALKIPKLLFETHPTPAFAAASDPKTIVTVPDTDPNYLESVRRFLDEYVPIKP
jgi:hypothetical protein